MWLWGWLDTLEICKAGLQEGQAEILGDRLKLLSAWGISPSGCLSSALKALRLIESGPPSSSGIISPISHQLFWNFNHVC